MNAPRRRLALAALVGVVVGLILPEQLGWLLRAMSVWDAMGLSGYVDQRNRPLICDNITTPMEFGFLYNGDLQSVQVALVGVTTGKR